MKKDKYTIILAITLVCAIFHSRYSEKFFTQTYKAWYGDAMLVFLRGAQIWPQKTNTNICFDIFYKCVN